MNTCRQMPPDNVHPVCIFLTKPYRGRVSKHWSGLEVVLLHV